MQIDTQGDLGHARWTGDRAPAWGVDHVGPRWTDIDGFQSGVGVTDAVGQLTLGQQDDAMRRRDETTR